MSRKQFRENVSMSNLVRMKPIYGMQENTGNSCIRSYKTMKIDTELHKQLKLLALKEDKTFQGLIEEVLWEHVKNKKD